MKKEDKNNKIKLVIEIVVFVSILCLITGFYYFGNDGKASEEEYESVGIVKVTDDNYEEILNSEGVVILEFSSNSCPPCLTMIPTMIDIAKNYKDIKVVNVNTSNNNTTNVTKKYNVEAYPTIFVLKDGEVIDTIIGATSEDNLLKNVK